MGTPISQGLPSAKPLGLAIAVLLSWNPPNSSVQSIPGYRIGKQRLSVALGD